MDYTDTDGPWEFSYTYTDILTTESFNPADGAVSGFAGAYPSEVTNFWNGAVAIGTSTLSPFLGEWHELDASRRWVYGLTELTLLAPTGTFIFTDENVENVPMEFIYPYYYGTDFTATGAYILPGPVPTEIFQLDWRVRGVGEGVLKLDPAGSSYNTLLLRHDLTIELNDAEFAFAVIYEWIIDDGNTLAYIMAGEAPGDLNNFDHGTGIIFGDAVYAVSQDY